MLKNFAITCIIFGAILGLWSLLPQAALGQTCLNECSFFGQHESQGPSGRSCGNYDNDSCLEWSAFTACDIQSFFCGDKTCNSSCGETFSNCSKDCTSPNPLPLVDAGPSKETFESGNVVLEGTASDPENESLTWRWECPNARLSDANLLRPIFYAPSSVSEASKVFTCTLRVTDFRGALTSDSAFITVKKPVITLSLEILARNITQKQASWQKIISALPSDRIEFKVEVIATDATANIILKDILPQKLSYQGSLRINGKLSNQNIVNLKIGNLAKDQSVTITFQAQLLPGNNFDIGTTALTGIVEARANFMPAVSDKVSLNVIKAAASLASASAGGGGTASDQQSLVKGATLVSTGTTNRILESLLPPLFIALLAVLAFRSQIIWLDEWLDKKRGKIRNYQTEASLKRKISQIKTSEKEIYQTWKR